MNDREKERGFWLVYSPSFFTPHFLPAVEVSIRNRLAARFPCEITHASRVRHERTIA